MPTCFCNPLRAADVKLFKTEYVKLARERGREWPELLGSEGQVTGLTLYAAVNALLVSVLNEYRDQGLSDQTGALFPQALVSTLTSLLIPRQSPASLPTVVARGFGVHDVFAGLVLAMATHLPQGLVRYPTALLHAQLADLTPVLRCRWHRQNERGHLSRGHAAPHHRLCGHQPWLAEGGPGDSLPLRHWPAQRAVRGPQLSSSSADLQHISRAQTPSQGSPCTRQ